MRNPGKDLRSGFESLGAACPDIQPIFVDRIDREPGATGRLKLIKSDPREEMRPC